MQHPSNVIGFKLQHPTDRQTDRHKDITTHISYEPELKKRRNLLSQPNNKATKTIVGLRLCNRWGKTPPPQTQNCMKESKLSNPQKAKVISLYEETQWYIFWPKTLIYYPQPPFPNRLIFPTNSKIFCENHDKFRNFRSKYGKIGHLGGKFM